MRESDTTMGLLRRKPKHKLGGWRKDSRDVRDMVFGAAAPEDLPSSVDLRECMKPVPVEDQGTVGSCTANALVGCMEFLHDCKNDEGGGNLLGKGSPPHPLPKLLASQPAQKDVPAAGELIYGDRYTADFVARKVAEKQAAKMAAHPGEHLDFSRLFLYYGERWIEHSIGVDAGAQIRNGVRVLAKQGVCLEDLWPYNPKRVFTQPPVPCFENAKKHRAIEYRRVLDLTGLKSALHLGYPVAFGFMVYASFESAAVAKTGRVPMPKTRGFFRERCLGGHAVLAVGYDDMMAYKNADGSTGRGCVICRNSWGLGWGDQGHFYLPYGFIESPTLSDDFWVITRAVFEEA